MVTRVVRIAARQIFEPQFTAIGTMTGIGENAPILAHASTVDAELPPGGQPIDPVDALACLGVERERKDPLV